MRSLYNPFSPLRHLHLWHVAAFGGDDGGGGGGGNDGGGEGSASSGTAGANVTATATGATQFGVNYGDNDNDDDNTSYVDTSYVDNTFGPGNIYTETTPGASIVNFGAGDDNDAQFETYVDTTPNDADTGAVPFFTNPNVLDASMASTQTFAQAEAGANAAGEEMFAFRGNFYPVTSGSSDTTTDTTTGGDGSASTGTDIYGLDPIATGVDANYVDDTFGAGNTFSDPIVSQGTGTSTAGTGGYGGNTYDEIPTQQQINQASNADLDPFGGAGPDIGGGISTDINLDPFGGPGPDVGGSGSGIDLDPFGGPGPDVGGSGGSGGSGSGSGNGSGVNPDDVPITYNPVVPEVYYDSSGGVHSSQADANAADQIQNSLNSAAVSSIIPDDVPITYNPADQDIDYVDDIGPENPRSSFGDVVLPTNVIPDDVPITYSGDQAAGAAGGNLPTDDVTDEEVEDALSASELALQEFLNSNTDQVGSGVNLESGFEMPQSGVSLDSLSPEDAAALNMQRINAANLYIDGSDTAPTVISDLALGTGEDGKVLSASELDAQRMIEINKIPTASEINGQDSKPSAKEVSTGSVTTNVAYDISEKEVEKINSQLGETVPNNMLESLFSAAGGFIAGAFVPGVGGAVADYLGGLGPKERQSVVDQHIAALEDGATPQYDEKGRYTGYNQTSKTGDVQSILNEFGAEGLLPGGLPTDVATAESERFNQVFNAQSTAANVDPTGMSTEQGFIVSEGYEGPGNAEPGQEYHVTATGRVVEVNDGVIEYDRTGGDNVNQMFTEVEPNKDNEDDFIICEEGFLFDPKEGICMPIASASTGGGSGDTAGSGSGFAVRPIRERKITPVRPPSTGNSGGMTFRTPKQFAEGGSVTPNIDSFFSNLR